MKRVAHLHDGSDPTNYHSLIKERGGTIDMILFVFHTFGNGAAFLRGVERSDACHERIAEDTVEEAFTPVAERLFS